MFSLYIFFSFLGVNFVRVPPTTLLTKWPLGSSFPSFWPFGPSFLTFWPFGASFPYILAFWAFIFFHFGLLGIHFSLLGFHFLHFGASFPFILPFWGFISFHFGLSRLPKRPPGQDLAQNCNFPFKFCNFSFSKICDFGPSFWPFEALFLTFWPFGASFCFILVFCAFQPGQAGGGCNQWFVFVVTYPEPGGGNSRNIAYIYIYTYTYVYRHTMSYVCAYIEVMYILLGIYINIYETNGKIYRKDTFISICTYEPRDINISVFTLWYNTISKRAGIYHSVCEWTHVDGTECLQRKQSQSRLWCNKVPMLFKGCILKFRKQKIHWTCKPRLWPEFKSWRACNNASDRSPL